MIFQFYFFPIKIGRMWNGKVEKLLLYNGGKIKCPTDAPKTAWLVSTRSGYTPDNALKLQCLNANGGNVDKIRFEIA